MSGYVSVFVTSPDTHSERRLDPSWSISQLKNKLELVTGVPTSNQSLTLLSSQEDAQVIADLNDDNKTLAFYNIRDYQVIKVVDTNPSTSFTGQLTDVTQVEKFELSDTAYSERTDTVLAYKQRNKVGRFADPSQTANTATSTAAAETIKVGSRCQVRSAEVDLHKRGTVRFVGPTQFGLSKPGEDGGIWVGIEYDEPFGKNDGSVASVRYFTCQPNYGVFIRPDRVDVGDYPVIDELNELEEM